MRFMMRLASLVALAAAVAAGTIDAIRSVALSMPAMTSLVDLLSFVGGNPAARLAGPAGGLPSFLQPAARQAFEAPAFAVLLGLSLLLWIAGYRGAPKGVPAAP
ncbi:hypothetical protein [Ensifer soli]|uniref:hypothetical protein n=1 Tax=Ciceribacter sp. sgz301302 TaxID=3342379 RepID=UPI0035B86324